MISQPSSLAAFIAITLVFALAGPAPAQPGAQPNVVVAPVIQRNVVAKQSFVATVQPLRQVTIGSAVDGRVVRFLVEEGDRVEAGQPLAQLRTETIALELTAAQAECELRRQQLAELRNGSRPEEIAQARARMIAAQARQRYAEARRDRAKAVYRSQGVITDDEYEEAVALAAEAEQNYLEAQAAHALAVAGPRVELIAQAEAQLAVQQATVSRLQDELAKHTVISRFAGYVVAEHTDEGAWVNRGDAVVEVVAIDDVDVIAQVVESNVAFIDLGQEVSVEVPALEGQRFPGRVAVSVPLADPLARTFPVKVRVTNQILPHGPRLMPGMLARVELPVGKKTTAQLVPKDAVVLGGPAPIVFVVDKPEPDGPRATVRSVQVRLGVASGALVQVIGKLSPGELVVVEGNERLRAGQEVRVTGTLAATPPAVSDQRRGDSTTHARQSP